MSTNPYESPENPNNPVPQKSNGKKIAVQLLVVVGILVVLVALLLPAARFGTAESAGRMACHNHLKQIWLALKNYEDFFQSPPPAYIADASGKPMHSWRVLILPFFDQRQATLFDKYNYNEPWNGPNNSKLHSETMHVYTCPSRPGRQANTDSSYVVVVGPQTAWPGE